MSDYKDIISESELNNVSLFSKNLATQVESIISNNINVLSTEDIAILQSLVVFITFIGNRILPKMLGLEPSLQNVFSIMANLYSTNVRLAQAIQSLK